MLQGPLSDEPKRRQGADVAHDHVPVECELSVLHLVLCVEVSWLMVLIEHADRDPEEHGDGLACSQYIRCEVPEQLA